MDSLSGHLKSIEECVNSFRTSFMSCRQAARKMCRLLVTLIRDDLNIPVPEIGRFKTKSYLRTGLEKAFCDFTKKDILQKVNCMEEVVRKCYDLNLTTGYRLGLLIEKIEEESKDIQEKLIPVVDKLSQHQVELFVSQDLSTVQRYEAFKSFANEESVESEKSKSQEVKHLDLQVNRAKRLLKSALTRALNVWALCDKDEVVALDETFDDCYAKLERVCSKRKRKE